MKKTSGLNTKRKKCSTSLLPLWENKFVSKHFIRRWSKNGTIFDVLTVDNSDGNYRKFISTFDRLAKELEFGEQLEYGNIESGRPRYGLIMVERWHTGKLILTHFSRTYPYDIDFAASKMGWI